MTGPLAGFLPNHGNQGNLFCLEITREKYGKLTKLTQNQGSVKKVVWVSRFNDSQIYYKPSKKTNAASTFLFSQGS